MIRCPYCDARFVLDSPPDKPPTSQQDEVSADDHDAWSPVARMANIAEAGFFCDLLSDDRIETRLQEIDDFDAVSGTWQRTFVVVVPNVHIPRALERMRCEVDASAENLDCNDQLPSEEALDHRNDTQFVARPQENLRKAMDSETTIPEDFFLETTRQQSGATAGWFPIVLALLTGTAVSWVATVWLVRDGKTRDPSDRSPLWNTLKESDSLWKTTRPGEMGHQGRVTRTLRYDEESDLFVLEEDLDGDLLIDRRREIHPHAMVVER